MTRPPPTGGATPDDELLPAFEPRSPERIRAVLDAGAEGGPGLCLE